MCTSSPAANPTMEIISSIKLSVSLQYGSVAQFPNISFHSVAMHAKFRSFPFHSLTQLNLLDTFSEVPLSSIPCCQHLNTSVQLCQMFSRVFDSVSGSGASGTFLQRLLCFIQLECTESNMSSQLQERHLELYQQCCLYLCLLPVCLPSSLPSFQFVGLFVC